MNGMIQKNMKIMNDGFTTTFIFDIKDLSIGRNSIMTVSELIERLQRIENQSAIIFVDDYEFDFSGEVVQTIISEATEVIDLGDVVKIGC